MESNVLDVLLAHEKDVEEGLFKTFHVKLEKNSLIVQAEGLKQGKTIDLEPDLYTTLEIYFYDVPAIGYKSYDYTTLISLLNAYFCIKRMQEKSITVP